jgi:diaminopimelate epimerase
VEAISQQEIAIRTYERGVEGETLACGTGVVAAAITHAVVHEAVSPVRVRTKGGALLEVGFQAENGGWTNVTLTGPATFVFSGAMEI